MPDRPDPTKRPHPWQSTESQTDARPIADLRSQISNSSSYVELQTTTNFTFLTGASHPEEYAQQAAALGHPAIAITDRNTLAGMVRAHVAAKDAGVRLIVGARIALNEHLDPPPDSPPQRLLEKQSVLLYPTDRAAYARLCRLLTLGKRRAPKGQCHLTAEDVFAHAEGMLAVAIPPRVDAHDPGHALSVAIRDAFLESLRAWRRVFDDDRLSLASSCCFGPNDKAALSQLTALAEHARVPLLATNDVHYHAPERRPLQDVLTCIRLGCTLDEAGLDLFPHGERCLKPAEAMAELFADHAHAIDRTLTVADRAQFHMDALRYQYPEETCPPDKTPMQHLMDLTWEGARERYGEKGTKGQRDKGTKGPSPSVPQSLSHSVPSHVQTLLNHEFDLIAELDYARYFLTVHDIVLFARARGILCQGRGAAANSAVCYCLGITSVDPAQVDLLFERFLSKERNEPPDIDIDFEHERREEVLQYIYKKYGRDRAALTAEVITYRGRSAVREVGKTLGLSLDCVDRISKSLDWWDMGGVKPERLREIGFNPDDPLIHRLASLASEILGFPRHLSQHVGGFVITQGPLCELVPIENAAMPDRTVIEWDKDDIDAMGMLKVDCLGLGMLTCLNRSFNLLRSFHELGQDHDESTYRKLPLTAYPNAPTCLDFASIPAEDSAVYDMICEADTVGVFQIESRAQMSMLPRLRPRNYYDLVIEVAIVRPGPIHGDMVHPYLRRRNGEEPVSYPDDTVKRILGKTLGVPLFQEQAMSLAIHGAGFTPGEADQLRRAIAAWKRKKNIIYHFGEKLIKGMTERGYPREFAERCFKQIQGFSEYGFPESHAASFALIVYASCWLKHYHPAAFAAALINSQPMGFYAPAQIVRDAQEHGVEVREVDVNRSGWDCSLEEGTKEQRDKGTKGIAPSVTQSLSPSVPSIYPPALRLGMRLLKGMREDEANAVAAAVTEHGPFRDIPTLWRYSNVRVAALRTLAQADAFRSMGLDRQAALWHIRQLRDKRLPLFDEAWEGTEGLRDKGTKGEEGYRLHADRVTDLDVTEQFNGTEDQSLSHSVPQSLSPSVPSDPPLPAIPLPKQVVQDYAQMGLSLKAHPVSFARERLNGMRVTPAIELRDETKHPHGNAIAVAGLVLVRQRPGTASGVVFMTLEDETGIANLVLWPKLYERFRRVARHSHAVIARGKVERQGQVVHVMVRHLEDLKEAITIAQPSRDFH